MLKIKIPDVDLNRRGKVAIECDDQNIWLPFISGGKSFETCMSKSDAA